jgi:hypothetical protein
VSGDERGDRARCGEEGGGVTVAVSSKLASTKVRNREGNGETEQRGTKSARLSLADGLGELVGMHERGWARCRTKPA